MVSFQLDLERGRSASLTDAEGTTTRDTLPDHGLWEGRARARETNRACGMKGRRSPVQGQMIKGEAGRTAEGQARSFGFPLKAFGGNSGFGPGLQEGVGESLL